MTGGDVDGTCWKLLGGMGVAVTALGGAVLKLWNAYSSVQEMRLKESDEHRSQIKAIYEYILSRRK